MRRLYRRTIKLFTDRLAWVRQILVASAACGVAWLIGNTAIKSGGVVAAIVCALSIRISLYKSVREGFGQIVGTAIGASVALGTVGIFHLGFIAVATTVLFCSIVARALHLGEVASVNVPVTALIVIGPGISGNTALHRLLSTLVEVANKSHLSLNTVKSHLKSIYRKLGADSRDSAVRIAREQSLL